MSASCHPHSALESANTEAQFHAEFRRYHHRREWYRFCDEMLTFEPEPEPPWRFLMRSKNSNTLPDGPYATNLAEVESELEWKEEYRAHDWVNTDWGGDDDDDDPHDGDLIAF